MVHVIGIVASVAILVVVFVVTITLLDTGVVVNAVAGFLLVAEPVHVITVLFDRIFIAGFGFCNSNLNGTFSFAFRAWHSINLLWSRNVVWRHCRRH